VLQTTESSAENTIQSVRRAITLLKSFNSDMAELSVTDLSKQLGLHKSTVSRLLTTLQHEHFVDRNPETGKYRLGWGIVTLAGAALARLDWRQIVHPHLITLTRQTNETTNVTILSGCECINVDGVPSPNAIQYVGQIGRRTPLHCTSTGRVLLAHLPPEIRAHYLPHPLPRCTQKTIVDDQLFTRELERVLMQGYAIVNEEFQEGLAAVAAPIFDHTGRAFAAIAISGPSYRMTVSNFDTLATAVKDTALAITEQLGGITSQS
jgi:IclR family acetate operon transcriptional repressor